jgi:hypothetical protein
MLSEPVIGAVVDFVDEGFIFSSDFDGAIKPYEHLPERLAVTANQHGKALIFIRGSGRTGYRSNGANGDFAIAIDQELDVRQ